MKKILSLFIAAAMVVTMMASLQVNASAGKLYACKVGETPYASVDAARHNAEQGSTIVLLRDITEDVYFESGDKFTIDLNGYGIINSDPINKTVHNNEGQLTIIDTNPTAEHYFNYVAGGAWTLIKNPTVEQIASAVPSYEADATHTVVKVCGGYITGNGVLNTSGTLTIERANLVGNNHTDGALQNRNGEVTYKNGEIVGNTGAEGGAIVNRNGILTIGVLNADNKNMIIAHNTALLYNGGAIATFVNVVDEGDCDGSRLTLNSGYIAFNKANEKGGAIANSITYTNNAFSTATVKMYGGIIENNEAELNGGGVANFNSSAKGSAIFELYDGSIINNKTVNRTAQDRGGNGGGVANTDDFRMYGGTIAQNQANLGGGVYNAHLFTMTNGEIKNNKAVLSSNNPQANGLIGGVYNDGNLGLGAAAFIQGGSIKDNTAARMVGGIFNEKGILVLSNATVTGNKSPYVGGIAQFGIMAIGGNTVIDGNVEGTKTKSNLLVADMKSVTEKEPVVLGTGSEITLAQGVQVTVPELGSDAKIGVTYAKDLNTTTYAFTKGAGRVTDSGSDTLLNNFYSDYDLTNVKYNNDGYIELIANVVYLDLDSTTTDIKDTKELEQKYNLTVEGGAYTDIIKVKLDWTLNDISATRKDAKKWDPTELKWVDDDDNDVVDAGDEVTATFKITNYSSILVYAKVQFEADDEAGFAPDSVTYTGVDENTYSTSIDTVVGDEHAVAANPTAPSKTVTVKVTPSEDDFAKLAATTSATKYGTYTITISDEEDCDCLAAGTKITMADGTLKNIEEIAEGDEVLTYNHEAGRFEAQKVYLAWACAAPKRAFTLHFTNEVEVSVIGDHCFFEKESLSYVAIFEDTADEFVGKHFYNAATGRYEELLSVTYETTPVDYYEIYTEYNGNCIAEGMLNVAYDSSEMLNIYKFNEDLTIDHEQLADDIATYGLFEYVENDRYSKELFDSVNWKYIYVMVGKGFGTMDEFHARANAFLGN